MSSLFTNKQQKKANKYSKVMAKAEELGIEFANDISRSLTPNTVKESFALINNEGHDYEKNIIASIESNYNSGKPLCADEWIQFNDIFVSVTNRSADCGGTNEK